MAGPWTRDETSASGQVFEFRVWAALTEQSRGQLHVFLPLSDRGVDALVHRLSDGAYIPVQAKGRSTLTNGEVHLVVQAESVADDSVLIVSGQIVDGGLGPAMLVVPAADFRRLAELSTADGRPIYAMAYAMNLRSHSRWLPWLVSSDRLDERFGVSRGLSLPAVAEERPRFSSSDLGFLGESEVVRRQVKTVTVNAAHPRPSVDVRISSFRPAPTTYFTVLAWMRDEGRFHEECLVFPSARLREFAREANGHFTFEFQPGSVTQGRLDSYRRALGELRAATEDLLVVK